jgi:hypothetical protein
MRNKFFLSSYTIRVEGKTDNDQEQAPKAPYLTLDCFTNGTDLLDVLLNYLTALKDMPIKDDQERNIISVSELTAKERRISGVIQSGLYGIQSKLIDIDTNNVVHERTTNQAEILPFYFLIDIPKGRNEGILILSRIGTYGIKTILSKFMEKHFLTNYSDFSILLKPLVPDQVVKQILFEGRIKKLRFIKYQIPTDVIDGFDEGHEEISKNLEMSISASRLPIVGRLKGLFDGSRMVKNLFEIQDYGFDYDTIKVEVEMGGSNRIVNLGNWEKVRNYVNITDRVTLGNNGYPAFPSIESLALELNRSLSDLMWKK